MRAHIISTLPASAEDVWELLQRSDTLVYIADGMVRYDSAASLPEHWSVGAKANLAPVLFGRFPAGDHHVEFVSIDHDRMVMQTNEHGGPITRWDHTMRVHATSPHSCRYEDEIHIEAGWRTPLVWSFAKLFYRHRHRRWMELLEHQFLRELC